MKYQPKEIRTLRLRAKLTQAALARELGVTSQSVKNWESGRRGISPRYHAQLEQLLGAPKPTKPAPNSRPKYVDLAPGDWEAASRYGWCELKYDGEYCELRGGPDGYVITNRKGQDIEHGSWPMPVCHLLMEHISGTEWARESPLRACYVAWAALSAEGMHLSRVRLQFLVAGLAVSVLPVSISECIPVGNAEGLWMYHVINGNWEGLIFRTAGGKFARMKKRVTMDYVVMGYEAGSILGGLYNKRGILTQVVRVPWSEEPHTGQVFEASGLAITNNGSLRNPRWDRWRPTKDPRECVK